jgi:PKD repeat protein
MRIFFRKETGLYKVQAWTLLDSGIWRATTNYAISDAAHYLELEWQAATGAGADDGALTLWIDGTEQQTLSNLDNDTQRLERAELGAVIWVDTPTRGTYYFDAFESRREGYMGPAGMWAAFNASPTTGTAPLTVNFTSLSVPAAQITDYLWDFGDGGTSDLANPTHEYTDEGQYTVTLTVSGGGDQDGVTKTSYITVGDLIFEDDFESGDLSAWDGAATGSGDLSVTSAAALAGVQGLQVDINDNFPLYVSDESPNNETRYRARFYFDPNGIEMANGDSHVILMGYSDSTDIMRIFFRKESGLYKVQAWTLLDSGAWRATTNYAISDAAHYLELEWQAATGAGADDGALTLWIDGVEQQTLSGLDNDTRRMERVQLGAVDGIDTTTRGTYYFDAFESRRESYIGE